MSKNNTVDGKKTLLENLISQLPALLSLKDRQLISPFITEVIDSFELDIDKNMFTRDRRYGNKSTGPKTGIGFFLEWIDIGGYRIVSLAEAADILGCSKQLLYKRKRAIDSEGQQSFYKKHTGKGLVRITQIESTDMLNSLIASAESNKQSIDSNRAVVHNEDGSY